MYQTTINPNISSFLPASPPPFTPPNYAVWVNALWFLSLVITITCALLATLLQQWARRYLKVTQPRYSLYKRARIRAFFAEGIDKFLLPWVVEALPTMLHLSLFLFCAGLAVFLWNVNLTIFKLVLSWIGLCMALYGCITFIPIFRYDSPYCTPLSLPAWHFITGIPFLTYRALEWIACSCCFSYEAYIRFQQLAGDCRKLLAQGMQKTAEECALSSPPEIDTRAFMWTFDCLDEDHELERFFAGLPGFRGSKMVNDPLLDLTWEQQDRLLDALIGLSDRTSSSNLLSEQVKIRRTAICGKAIDPLDVPQVQRVLHRIMFGGQLWPPQSAAIAHLVKGWDDGNGQYTTTIIRAIVLSAVVMAQRDDLWFAVSADAMGVPESVLRNHATHGDSLSLAILIHVIHQQFRLAWAQHWPFSSFLMVLEAASQFNVLDTSPDLQHEFCTLWNQVRAHGLAPILKPIRNIYLTLHLHTDCAPTQFSASTDDADSVLLQSSVYPFCNIPGHHPHSAPQIHDISTSMAIPHAVLQDLAAPVPSFLAPSAPSPSSFLTTPVHVDENAEDVPLLANLLVPAPSSRSNLTVTENLRDSATSPDPVVAVATGDNSSVRAMLPTIRKSSMSSSSVPPLFEASLQNNASLLAHSGEPEIPYLASPDPVLDDIAGPSLSLTLTFATNRLS